MLSALADTSSSVFSGDVSCEDSDVVEALPSLSSDSVSVSPSLELILVSTEVELMLSLLSELTCPSFSLFSSESFGLWPTPSQLVTELNMVLVGRKNQQMSVNFVKLDQLLQ